ncbi:MAG TPA: LLM class flavin-dependent oxidoreductase [Ktedonobacteraceae bacterium]|jgi:alkanesulfonate monooxygenase SsuD/methylene tetrahydromethanopterin reductase-like flavin-dependent oxidoreductase (luciferase family)|nr:LLM class flavin-dependent oxidoreductase [Ktedonobacteraceae bacterium]
MPTIDFGLMLRPSHAGNTLGEVMAYNRQCIEAMKTGFTTIWLEDHLQSGQADQLECFSTISFLAAQYPQFHFGTLVLDQSYRNPALLAKMAANLQFLTGGRLIIGLGAGWKEDEYIAYGYRFPDTRTRLEELEEAAIILRAMWTSQSATYAGKHYRVANAWCEPQPSPVIPLLIGGGGERHTLAIVARHADWWNYNSVPVEEYARKLAILKKHCEAVGRNIAEIRLTYLATLSVSEDPSRVIRHPQKHYLAGNAAQVTRELQQFCELGVTHFMLRIPDLATLEHFITAVVPHLNN